MTTAAEETPPDGKPAAHRHPFLRALGLSALIALILLISLWTFGAIHFDGPFPGRGNTLLGIAWLGLSWITLTRFRHPARRFAAWALVWAVAFIPWLMKRPSNDRDWAPEFSRTPTAEIRGDVVTFREFRNFDYEPDGTAIERWETRQVRLSNLRGMDFFLNYWDSELIAHPLFSFDFGPDGHVVFSIETRREKNESFTTLGGLYKLYELVYIVGSESDLVRLRTNVRAHEDVYLHRLAIKPETARLRFLEYLAAINELAENPRFYNVINANCTTAIRSQMTTRERANRDWRILANGKLDELFDERGLLAGDMPLAERKRRSHINTAARAHGKAEGFSEAIRTGLAGFE